MNIATTAEWLTDNQRRLTAALGVLRTRLEALSSPNVADHHLPPADPPPALRNLSSLFDLGPFEETVLLLCAGVALDRRLAAACAKAGYSRGGEPTFELALTLVPEGPWSALCPQAPLRRWRLIELESSGALMSRPIRIDERVLHYLAGVNYLDARLDGLLEPLTEAPPLTGGQIRLTERIAEAGRQQPDGAWPVLQLCGPDAAGKTAIAAEIARRLDSRAYRLAAEDVPHAVGERQALARVADRELAFSGAILLLRRAGPPASEADERQVARLVDDLVGPVIVATPDPLPLERCRRLRLDVPPATREERRDLWHGVIGARADMLGPTLDRLADQFGLDNAGIRTAADMALNGAGPADPAALDRLWEACRVQARRRLDDLAERIESCVGWDDLVLPPDQLAQLKDVAVHVRQAHRVHEAWGWGAKSGRGLGITALFSGPSGTGKTLAAEVLANELRLDLYRIDLSQVVSKYIGETEKNLRRIFEAAEASGAILLFDEADALFGKRSEVKDSHDRYANVEVSYLLQRMEAYRGLAVLTTNLKGALDAAFLRRLRFVVQFPFPDAASRSAIWTRIFPDATPTDRLDFGRLARLTIAGGSIRTIAINAAFAAAEAGVPVGMDQVLAAARQEYAKLEKPLTSGELGRSA
jgi:ATPase family associated with various cellular activities (AAA)